MGAASTSGLDGTLNPFSTLSVQATRIWNDNGNLIPDRW